MLARLTRSRVADGTQFVVVGTSTLLLIRCLAVDREQSMRECEIALASALSQLLPGIRRVALAE